MPEFGDSESLKLLWNGPFLRIVGKRLDRSDEVMQQGVRTIVSIQPALRQAALPDTRKIALRTGRDLDRYRGCHNSV